LKNREPFWKAAKYGTGEVEVWFVGDPRGKTRLRAKLTIAGFGRRDTNTFTAGVVMSTIESVEEYVRQIAHGTPGVTVWYRYIPVDLLTLTHQITPIGR